MWLCYGSFKQFIILPTLGGVQSAVENEPEKRNKYQKPYHVVENRHNRGGHGLPLYTSGTIQNCNCVRCSHKTLQKCSCNQNECQVQMWLWFEKGTGNVFGCCKTFAIVGHRRKALSKCIIICPRLPTTKTEKLVCFMMHIFISYLFFI